LVIFCGCAKHNQCRELGNTGEDNSATENVDPCSRVLAAGGWPKNKHGTSSDKSSNECKRHGGFTAWVFLGEIVAFFIESNVLVVNL
jgi:hypothetical protein